MESSGCREGAWAEFTAKVTSIGPVRSAMHVKRICFLTEDNDGEHPAMVCSPFYCSSLFFLR